MHELDAQARACPQQPGVHERRPVVHVDRFGDAAAGQRRAQRGGEPDGVLAEAEPGGHHGPGAVIEEREKIGLAAGDHRAVQRVAGPDLIAPAGLEPAEYLRVTLDLPVQLKPGEMALQGPVRGRPAGLGAQDAGHLHSGSLRVLPLQRHRQREHLSRCPRGHPRGGRHQGLEPARPPCPGPPPDGLLRYPYPGAGRAVVLPPGKLADQRTALGG